MEPGVRSRRRHLKRSRFTRALRKYAAVIALAGASLFLFVVILAIVYGTHQREPARLPPPAPSRQRVAAVTAAPAWTHSERSLLERRLETTFANPIFTEHGGLVVLAGDGTRLFSHRARVPMTPASTLKLVIAATALDVFGAQHRFDTRLVALADRPDARGILHSPLWLVGGGDPLLTWNELQDGIGVLRHLGIKQIDGPLVADDDAFAGPERHPHWDPSDLEEGYAAATSAISLDQGTVEFHVTPGEIGRRARVTIVPPNEEVEVGGEIVTAWQTDFRIERSVESASSDSATRNAFAVSGTIAQGKVQKVWKPIVGVPPYVGGAMLALLARQGISVTGGTKRGSSPLAAQLLWLHHSRSLAAIVAEMLRHSNNHSAEQLLRLVGRRSEVLRGSDEAGLAAERRELYRLGIAVNELRAYDASGLAPGDAIAPLALAQLLAAELHGPNLSVFLQSLPRVGIEGTVKDHQLHAALGRARAKSGHILNVNGLAGTVLTRRHGRVAFAFLVNDPHSESAAVYRAQDRALDTLATF